MAVTNGDNLDGLEFAGFPDRKRKPEQSSPLLTENQRNLRLSPLTVRHGKTGLDRFCTKNGAGRSGDITGGKLGGLTDHSRRSPCSEFRFLPRKACEFQPAELVTACHRFVTARFLGAKVRKTGPSSRAPESQGFPRPDSPRPVFGGKRANLEAQAPLLTSDTKKRTFRS